MDQQKVNRSKVFFCFFILSLVLIAVWFRGGSILGGGEANIPFYNLSRALDASKSSWTEMHLGTFISQGVSSAPFYFVLSKLQGLGISGYLIEAVFFLVMVYLTLISMYLFSEEILPNIGVKGWVFASLFYFFNLYSLANVWNRFLLNLTLFYAVFPLIVMLFLKGLKHKSYKYSIIIALGSIVFSFAFSSPVSMFIFWGTAFLLSLYFFFLVKKEIFVIKFFFTTFVFWFLLNFWWISQDVYFGSSQAFKDVSSIFFTQAGNADALNTLSNLLGRISNVFLLKHGTFFTADYAGSYPLSWPLFYNSPFAIVIEWGVILSILFVAIKESKDKWVKFLIAFFIFAVFISKGNNIPFGALFNFGFENFSFIQFFRNPFEKLGILLSFAISPLFGLMIVKVFSFVYERRKRLAQGILGFFVLYIFGFLGFPFFTGLVFTSGTPPTNNLKVGIQVDVPSYYKEASAFLESDKSLFRYLTFPLGGEGIFYNWSKGYAGVELSPLLLGVSGISNSIDLPYFKEIALNLERIFMTYEDFYKIAGLLNIKYLVLRPDINFGQANMRDPQTILADLDTKVRDSKSKIDFIKDIGPLKLYKVDDSVFQQKAFAGGGVVTSNQTSNLEGLLLAGGSQDSTLFFNGVKLPQVIEDRNFATILHTNAVYRINQPTFPVFSDEAYIFPYVSKISSSVWYPLVLLKEKLQDITLQSNESRASYHILLLGKRLIETQKAIEMKDYKAAQRSLEIYDKDLDRVLSEINGLVALKVPSDQVWHQSEMYTIFSSHRYLLNQFENGDLNKEGFVAKIKEHFRKSISDAKILPYYDLIFTDLFPIKDRTVYKIYVEKAGEYEIVFPKTLFFPDAFNLEKSFYIQIDNNLEKRSVFVKGNLASFGKESFSEGIHEIGFNQTTDENLVDIPKELVLETANENKEFSYPFSKFDPYSGYNLSLDYITNYGKGFTISIGTNNDYGTEDSKYFFNKNLGPDNYFYDFRNFSTVLLPRVSSDYAKLILDISPWNDCMELYSSAAYLCKNPSFLKLFNRPTKVVLKNVVVRPQLPNDLLLIERFEEKPIKLPDVEIKKINSSKYEVSVKNATEPFVLVFSELYDSNWKAYFADNYSSNILEKFLSSGKSRYLAEDNHFFVNGYANGWLISKTGDFNMVLEFWPQNLFYVGLLVSGGGALVLLYFYFRRR